MEKTVSILGSTGSIGTQSLTVCQKQGYPVYALTAHSNWKLLEQQIRQYRPRYAALTDPQAAKELKDRVLNYLGSLPRKSPDEIESNIAWCRKMLLRANRKDAEGMFRWHWLLTDSLEIFCDAVGQFYFGPKKSLRWMAKEYPAAYDRYAKALFSLDYQAAREWVECLETLPPPVPVEV